MRAYKFAIDQHTLRIYLYTMNVFDARCTRCRSCRCCCCQCAAAAAFTLNSRSSMFAARARAPMHACDLRKSARAHCCCCTVAE